nr:transposase [Pseudarthrobacter sp. L1SW]
MLTVTGATTAKVEANNTAIKHIKRTGAGIHQRAQLQNAYPVAQCRENSKHELPSAEHSPRTVKSLQNASAVEARGSARP